MLPQISYQRSAREYHVIDTDTGEIVETFPAGMKDLATRHAISYADPRLARIIKQEILINHPYLESRAWKAAAYVVEDKVTPMPNGPYLAVVEGKDLYQITRADGLTHCNCFDYVGFGAPLVGTNGQRVCKHILATQLVNRLAKRRCYHCLKLAAADLEDCPHCGELITPF